MAVRDDAREDELREQGFEPVMSSSIRDLLADAQLIEHVQWTDDEGRRWWLSRVRMANGVPWAPRVLQELATTLAAKGYDRPLLIAILKTAWKNEALLPALETVMALGEIDAVEAWLDTHGLR